MWMALQQDWDLHSAHDSGIECAIHACPAALWRLGAPRPAQGRPSRLLPARPSRYVQVPDRGAEGRASGSAWRGQESRPLCPSARIAPRPFCETVFREALAYETREAPALKRLRWRDDSVIAD